MELKQIEYSCFRPHADLSSSSLGNVDLLQSCWEPHENWMQSINLCPSLAATQWNSSKFKRYMPLGGNCVGVFESLFAWDEQHQFYICRSTRPCLAGGEFLYLRENFKYGFYVFPYSKIKPAPFVFPALYVPAFLRTSSTYVGSTYIAHNGHSE